jgi:acyl carrier protein
VLAEYGQLKIDISLLSDEDDLFSAGLSSHASVSVMLGLEDAFGIEFPDSMLRRGTFSSVASIREAVAELESHHLPVL